MTFAKRAIIVFSLAVFALIAGLATATQIIVGASGYPREFGRALAEIGAVRIYPPWAVLDWYPRYAPSYPDAFAVASLWGLLAAACP